MTVKQNMRYLYEYYKHGGLWPWLATGICNFTMPLIYGSMLYMFLVGPKISYYLLILIFPAMDSLYMSFWLLRKIPGILFARKVYSDVGVLDEQLKCIKWPNIAAKLMDNGLIENETDFCAFNVAIDCLFIDSFNLGLIPLDITENGIDILRHIVHRSIRGNYNIYKSAVLQTVFEILFWPYLIISRVFAIVTKHGPGIYFKPGSLISRDYRPSMMYRFRGYYELEFEMTRKLSTLRENAQEFLDEFPSPLLESTARFITNISGLLAIYCVLIGHISWLVIIATILVMAGKLSGRASGGYNPCNHFATIADRFELNRDDPQTGLNFLVKEMPRRCYLLFFEFITVVFAPLYCIYFTTIAADLQLLLGKKIVTISGEPGIICSTKNYQHTSYAADITDFIGDPWLAKSTYDFEKEFGATIRRGQDQV